MFITIRILLIISLKWTWEFIETNTTLMRTTLTHMHTHTDPFHVRMSLFHSITFYGTAYGRSVAPNMREIYLHSYVAPCEPISTIEKKLSYCYMLLSEYYNIYLVKFAYAPTTVFRWWWWVRWPSCRACSAYAYILTAYKQPPSNELNDDLSEWH